MLNSKPKILMIITLDSKGEEAKFIRGLIEESGCEVIHLDASVRRNVGGAEISPVDVAQAAGMTIEEVRALGHEGKCLEAMRKGAVALATALNRKQPISGVIGVGGSLGTNLGSAVMRALPYGIPKVLVSTMASGFTVPYVGHSDIAMFNSVADISGLNRLSRMIYRNAVAAVTGMAKSYQPIPNRDRPLVLMTTLSTTEKCVRRVREALEKDGCEVMVFHSNGNGGPTMDSIAAGWDVAAVLDLSLVEIMDTIQGGLMAGGPERGKAALARGIPTIFAPGNAEFMVGGPLESAMKQFPGRRYHVHNSELTAVRANLDDLKKFADHMAKITADAKGPVQFYIPLRGFSNHDSPDGHIHDPDMPRPFSEYMHKVMPKNVVLRDVDAHLNDPEFADTIIAAARGLLSGALRK